MSNLVDELWPHISGILLWSLSTSVLFFRGKCCYALLRYLQVLQVESCFFNKLFYCWFDRLNCGVIAHSGLMMGCAISGIVLYASVQKASFQSPLRNHPDCFLLTMWFVRRENHRLLWIGPLMIQFSKDGLRLTILGHNDDETDDGTHQLWFTLNFILF